MIELKEYFGIKWTKELSELYNKSAHDFIVWQNKLQEAIDEEKKQQQGG